MIRKIIILVFFQSIKYCIFIYNLKFKNKYLFVPMWTNKYLWYNFINICTIYHWSSSLLLFSYLKLSRFQYFIYERTYYTIKLNNKKYFISFEPHDWEHLYWIALISSTSYVLKILQRVKSLNVFPSIRLAIRNYSKLKRDFARYCKLLVSHKTTVTHKPLNA